MLEDAMRSGLARKVSTNATGIPSELPSIGCMEVSKGILKAMQFDTDMVDAQYVLDKPPVPCKLFAAIETPLHPALLVKADCLQPIHIQEDQLALPV
eukprot:CAMPEP_0179026778 /NCGR_PEP_ID=MMETSP0796-20121207/8695_1 /TAXON_ID=73915 /ORGANISM="Pyrodinium bahamense, Strain pbaha01" /LENGTH=96 /DNA_ID=CAMNT_0020722879 /DNA_START=268 /DNA_END=558 /DNA_ORIENTATION=-